MGISYKWNTMCRLPVYPWPLKKKLSVIHVSVLCFCECRKVFDMKAIFREDTAGIVKEF